MSSETTVNRIQICLNELKANNKKALVSYIVAGDRSLSDTHQYMQQLVKSGTDIIELGMPFTDPCAEGQSIQLAHERALENSMSLGDIFGMVRQFRQQDSTTPIVLMGYANPIEWMGHEQFSKNAAQAGVDGVIIVDIPPEEAKSISSALKQHGLVNIFLLAPTTTEQRIQSIVDMASGFLYYVSLKGVTGSAQLDVNSVAAKLKQIRVRTQLPICVGFGIKSATTAAAIANYADGVVVGSAIVDRMARADNVEQGLVAVEQLVSSIRSAI